MKKLFKMIFSILFWQSLYLLTIFYIPEKYYPQWLIGFIFFFLLVSYISFKIIPSPKEQKLFEEIKEDYKNIIKLEEEVRQEALKLIMQCPECKFETHYWAFIDDYKCNKCGSEKWSTAISEKDEVYEKILKKREKIQSFNDKMNPRIKRKLRKFKLSGQIR